MIISRTPLRISFAGGGTDIKGFYEKEGGAVLNTTIDKYIYVVVKRNYINKIHLSASAIEEVDHTEEIQHDLVREALKKVGIQTGIDICIMTDVPSQGTGLGSSSSLTVGLLNALHTYQGDNVNAMVLAKEACEIEIDILKSPIGKQDQYAVALGGLRHVQFHPDEEVYTEHIKLSEDQKIEVEDRLMLFYTGINRSASTILTQQVKRMEQNMTMLQKLKVQSFELKEQLERGNYAYIGNLLAESWKIKKTLTKEISNSLIDIWFEQALEAGAEGGKIAGAGGGGFLLIYAEKKFHQAIRLSLPLPELTFKFENQGSMIVMKS
ncbi:hypothetical protein A8L34_09545 [Bacillus sp. FJAT-27264]|uniref:GHMP family kinase ATP-binding protein n=1 Tax=Paenibacillus sp. (strain DSM 101736 / FJAT-27264) TaxID=1850362 RepID=UPI0008080857|nr:hypothetical protein [Bacillus sp. FJAT-27264]OBZ14194.1 hypothetical protein A8L34_09545 [Bacillus sp. FJAT-27264]